MQAPSPGVHVESWRTTYRGIVPDVYLAGLNAEERTIRWREALNSAGGFLWLRRTEKSSDLSAEVPIREPLGGCDAELYAIYLFGEAQNKGIGAPLLLELAKRLDADGFQSMAVWVLEANPAVEFYVRLGASRVAAQEIRIAGATLPAAVYAWPESQEHPVPALLKRRITIVRPEVSYR